MRKVDFVYMCLQGRAYGKLNKNWHLTKNEKCVALLYKSLFKRAFMCFYSMPKMIMPIKQQQISFIKICEPERSILFTWFTNLSLCWGRWHT